MPVYQFVLSRCVASAALTTLIRSCINAFGARDSSRSAACACDNAQRAEQQREASRMLGASEPLRHEHNAGAHDQEATRPTPSCCAARAPLAQALALAFAMQAPWFQPVAMMPTPRYLSPSPWSDSQPRPSKQRRRGGIQTQPKALSPNTDSVRRYLTSLGKGQFAA